MSATQDFDTGPLNWVRKDIEAALNNAADRVRAFEGDHSLENALRLARDEVHTVTGALRMVGLEGATKVASVLEDTLSGMANQSIAADNSQTRALLNALEALLKWVGRMADGRGEGELALFPAYRSLRAMLGEEQVFEGELFFPSLKIQRPANLPDISQDELSQRVKAARSDFQRGLLAFLRNVKPEAGLSAMRRALAEVESCAPSPASRAFWWACAGFVDALQNKGIEPDFNVKQLLARVDLQMRRLMEGSPQVAERLMRDALFFVATSKALGAESQAVRAAFALEKYIPRQPLLSAEQAARLKPVMQSIKETLTEARTLWNNYSEGNSESLPQFEVTTGRLFTQAGALNISSLGGLISEVHDTALAMRKLDPALHQAAQLEIATTLLFLQNCIDTEEVLEASFATRAQSQVRRLSSARAGQAESDATDLLDETARKAAEHALFAQLGKEITSSLQQIEEILDTFFRDPDARDGLTSLSSLAAQVQGALAILDQPDAAQLLQSAIDTMRPYMLEGTPSATEKTRTADAISSLGLFVTAHLAGREDAARILQPAQIMFGLVVPDTHEDEEQTVEAGLASRYSSIAAAYLEWQDTDGEEARKKCLAALSELGHDADLIADVQLKSASAAILQTLREQTTPDAALSSQIAALTGIEIPPPAAAEVFVTQLPDTTAIEDTTAEDIVAFEQDSVQHDAVAEIAIDENADEIADKITDDFAAEPSAADIITAPESAPELELVSSPPPPIAEAAADLVMATEQASHLAEPMPAAPPTSAQSADTSAIDAELLDIFLEEAEEVLGNLSAATENCASSADDRDSLTIIRRAFHTLKGSGRMVGLAEFGEAGWGMEQLLNGWLAAEKTANAELLAIVRRAHLLFVEWVAALRDNANAWLDYHPLLADAAGLGLAVQEKPATPPPASAPAEICIGDVCLSPGLYDVFKAESAQWAGTLEEESQRLALVQPAQVSETVRRGVHTLAGIAGTTGFTPLSELSAAVENYLRRLELAPVPDTELPVLQNALAEICGMIRQIHASTPPQPAPALLEQLNALPAPPAAAPVIEAAALTIEIAAPEVTGTTEIAAIETEDLETPQPAEPAPETAVEPVEIEAISIQTQSEPPAETATEPADEISLQDMIEQARKANAPVFEQRQVQDELDEVLLPIFLEEAEALVPEAADALRNWKNSPASADAPSALRRVLHTIKGSARMAGAMRLGELTHIMESRVIAVLEGQAEANNAMHEALQDEFDRMADTIDRLKSGTPDAVAAHTATAHVATEVADTEVIITEVATGSQDIDQADHNQAAPAAAQFAAETAPAREAPTLRVRADWVDRMVNQAGEVAIARSRIESEMFALKRQVTELSEALRRLKDHLREVEIQAESQMQATFQSQTGDEHFDPLEFDRFTRFQEVTRFMAESVHDVSTVQQNLSIQLGEADAALLQQSRINRELQQNLLRVRMVPLYSVSERLYRVVRQAARDAGKRAQLDISGGDLELDRGVLEKVVAPLEHLLRNAIAHGLESPEARIAANKAEFGEVQLGARHEGNEMVLTIKDDGVGLNLARIREKATAQGLLTEGVEPSEAQLAQMIFVAGFTTAQEVTQLSGRGVGMDVVKNEIASLGGRIEIATESGKGVTFTIYLPLTLAVTQAVMIHSNKHEFALPATLVQQVQELKPEQLAAAMQAGAIEWRGNRYPLFYLPHLLGQYEAAHEIQRYNAIVLMKSGSAYAALLVDMIEGTREVVVKNIGPQLSRVTGIAGATVRGDGKVVLILNPVPLAMRALQARAASDGAPPREASTPAPAATPQQAPLVLVVDDSLTVRKITTRLMNREGYRVDTAKDGVDALEKMQDIMPDVVLLDVEMPRMDGFELARVMRNDARLRHVPIIMITSRTADKHRNHAIEIGVNVYLGKPFQEAVLLGHIADLLGERALISL